MDFSRKKVKDRLNNTGSEEVREKNRFLMFLVTLVVGLVVGGVLIFGAVAAGVFVQIIRDTPEIESLDQIKPNASKSIIYADDGSIMQELVQSGSNRISVSIDKVPQDLIDAIVDIEDARFFDHNGVDVKGVIRAVVVGLTSGSLSEGASTITQQVIKNNVFDGGFETNVGDRITRKFQEQALALKVEKQLDKNTILQYYLNTINLGSNCLGVQVAAQRYFGKDVSELDLSECTVIVATTSSPNRYNPITHPEKNQVRRLIVLDKMLEEGHITQEEHDAAASEDVYKRVLSTSEVNSGTNTFSYFTDTVFEDVMDRLQTDLGYSEAQATAMLYSGGLRIYSTMNPEIQAAIEAEVNDPNNYIAGGVNYLEYALSYKLGIRLYNGDEYYYDETNVKRYFREVLGQQDFNNTFSSKEALNQACASYKAYVINEIGGEVISENIIATIEPQTSVVVMDQSTGYVKGIVGGRGDKSEIGSLVLNRATQSTRQPGSTFKVISTYAPALDIKGATLGTTYYDSAYIAGDKNIGNWWGSSYVGYANIREAIMASANIIAVKCLENTVSESLAYDYVKSFGVTSLVPQDKSPVFCLGGLTYGVSNLEMTAAYATIANMGVYNTPVYWTKVTDANGNVLLSNEVGGKTVIQEETAKLLTSAMEETVSPKYRVFPAENIDATNTPCQVSGMHIAGKSGTTNDANDLWFIGYSPYYTMGIWCGYDSNKAYGNSPGYHKTIWQKIMTRISASTPDKAFDYSGLEKARICSKSGLLAREGVCDQCGDPDCHIYEEYFTKNTVPTEFCSRHVEFGICTASNHLATDNCPEASVEKKVYLVPDKKDSGASITGDSKFMLPADLIGTSCEIHSGSKKEKTDESKPSDPKSEE